MVMSNPSRAPKTGRASSRRVKAAQPPRRRLPTLLRRAWFNLNQTFRRRIARTGITPGQFTVLRNLAEGDKRGLTQSELTDLMSSDPNTIASLLKRMEKSGLVQRNTHETDGRAYRICLGTPGRRKYEQVRETALGLQLEILSVIPEAKREEFLKNLELIADACRLAAGGMA
jgi:DNA-binding MarR family transcriptional regulator